MLIYRIADPGQGFSLEHITHSAINNPEDDPLRHAFVREEKGLRPGGLGLAITRQIVEAHGGTIACEGRSGRGTRFWLHLPAREEAPSHAESPSKVA